jgi:hypothetical protein
MEHDVFSLEGVNINDTIDSFVRFFQPEGKYEHATGSIKIYIIEEYYFRIESNLAAIVIFEKENKSTLIVHIIIAGGKSGIMGVSWGAEKSMLKKIKNFFIES